jgi:hypothetical protein
VNRPVLRIVFRNAAATVNVEDAELSSIDARDDRPCRPLEEAPGEAMIEISPAV